MKVNVITLCEGHYHYGVAALINSLTASGHKGKITVYYRGDLPAWTRGLAATADRVFEFHGCTLAFKSADVSRHLGYHKPFAALEEFEADPNCEAVIYADPDVLFLAPWKFFEDWLGMSVALCLDLSFPYVPENHPWRKTWKELLARATGAAANDTTLYVNSGFFGLTRSEIDFLRQWAAVTQKFEEEGGDTKSFHMNHREKAIVGDQDLLAATLMGWKGRTSILGQEAMGFTGYYFILSHDVAHPKAWKRSFVWESIRGIKPSVASFFYLKYANGPLTPHSSVELFIKRLSLGLAKFISRFWSR